MSKMIKNAAILALINGSSALKLQQNQNAGVRFVEPNGYEQAEIAQNSEYLQLSSAQKQQAVATIVQTMTQAVPQKSTSEKLAEQMVNDDDDN